MYSVRGRYALSSNMLGGPHLIYHVSMKINENKLYTTVIRLVGNWFKTCVNCTLVRLIAEVQCHE